MRKTLLVLDYAIESAGSLFMFLIFFIGENKVYYSLLYQRILFSLGTFVYGVPIPLAHLLNESRVRDIIVNNGWVEGLKSVFYSDDKIRDLEKQNRTSSTVKERTALLRGANDDGFNGILNSFNSVAPARENQTSRVTVEMAIVHDDTESQNE